MTPDLDQLVAEHSFSGVVGVESDGELHAQAFGMADRAHGVANTVDHRLGIASGAKTLTALAVLSASAEERIDLDQPVRKLLGDELRLVDDGATVRHLLHDT